MKIHRKWTSRVLILVTAIYVSVFSARLIFSWVDYSRIDSFRTPIFASPSGHANGGFAHLSDGGTTNFAGFGYDITMTKRIDTTDDGVEGYQYGPKLTYRWRALFLPLPESKNVRFVSESEMSTQQNAR